MEGSVCLRKKIKILVLSAMLLCSASIASAESFQLGDQGTDVAEIQGQLSSFGYDVAADGDFGPATAEAVKDFQATHGLAVDGMVGPSTYEALLGKSMPQVSRGSNYIVRRVISDSMQYIGVPYSFGGTTPAGFDCSGFVRYVFANAGIYLPRTADAQYDVGYPVSSMLRRAVVSRLTICTAATGGRATSEHAALCDDTESGEGHCPSFFIGVCHG